MGRDLTVVQYGTDSSGRAIWMTRYMIQVFEAARRHPKVAPFSEKITIVQGAFMVRNGGGASASAGYHDAAGCIDIRTWNLAKPELDTWIQVTRMLAFAFWRRDETPQHGGMDPHAHGTLGTDGPLSGGALVSWRSYVGGGDGLAGPGQDYEWRPSPLVIVPPPNLLEEDYLMSDAAEKKLDQILAQVTETNKDLDAFRSAEWKRDKVAAEKAKQSKAALVAALGGVVDAVTEASNRISDAATKKQLQAVAKQVLKALADDPDVDGPENPA